MRHTRTRRMLDYWMGHFVEDNEVPLPVHQRPFWPMREAIRPAECADILGDMFILDIDHGVATYRLAGTRLCAMLGRELKGEGFDEAFAEADHRTATSWAANVGIDDYAALICSDGLTDSGNILPIETLILPLNHNGRGNVRALGITVPLEMPVWLGTRPIGAQVIRSVRVLRPWDDIDSGALSAQRMLAVPKRGPQQASINQNQPRFTPSPAWLTENTSARRIGHLMVVEGGKASH